MEIMKNKVVYVSNLSKQGYKQRQTTPKYKQEYRKLHYYFNIS